MNDSISATYRNGTLVLDEPLEISEGSKVNVVVIPAGQAESPGRKVAKILAEIAALPLEGEGKFSGRDHDQILYGKANEK